MKRIAYAQVELPDGTLLKRQVVEFSEGKYLRHFPLTEELAFTEWRNEKYIIKGESRTDAKPSAIKLAWIAEVRRR